MWLAAGWAGGLSWGGGKHSPGRGFLEEQVNIRRSALLVPLRACCWEARGEAGRRVQGGAEEKGRLQRAMMEGRESAGRLVDAGGEGNEG